MPYERKKNNNKCHGNGVMTKTFLIVWLSDITRF